MSETQGTAERMAVMEREIGHLRRRVEEQTQLADSVHALTVKVERQGVELNHLVGKLTELVDDIRDMRERPARRWEGMVTQMISMLVAAALGALFAGIGF